MIRISKPYPSRTIQRRGATTIIIALVVLLMISGILLTLVSTGIRNRQQVHTELQMEQTMWLLDAGIGATIKRAKQDPEFEKFEISVSKSLDRFNGDIHAIVTSKDESELTVQVTARLKGKNKHSPVTQRSRVVVLERSDSTN